MDTFGSVRKKIKELKGELENLRNRPMRVGLDHLELKINENLVELYHREEIMWRQRAQIEWLASGDKNTFFFHQRANKRRRRNMIKSLAATNGVIIDDPVQM